MTSACSQQGVIFICGFEKFEAMPYLDGGGLPTIGYGTRIASLDLYPHGITIAQARTMMAAHLLAETKSLNHYTALTRLLQHQYDAVVSLAYNIGVTAFLNSTIYKQIAAQSHDLSSWLWYHLDAKHKDEPGLDIRREKELKLFVYGTY